MYQKHIIIGRLGKDPDLRFTPAGQPVCNYPIAAERVYLDKAGKQVKETTWYSIRAWGKLAESCEKLLTKGRMVMVEGRLICDPKTGGPVVWFDTNHNPHANFEITASVVKFLTPTNTLGAEPTYVSIDDPDSGDGYGNPN